MIAFVFGAIVGGLAAWHWREEITRYIEQGREGAVEVLDKSRRQADAVIDRAKEALESGARTDSSAQGAGGSAATQGGSGAALGQPAKPQHLG
jgi:hypothetical protein